MTRDGRKYFLLHCGADAGCRCWVHLQWEQVCAWNVLRPLLRTFIAFLRDSRGSGSGSEFEPGQELSAHLPPKPAIPTLRPAFFRSNIVFPNCSACLARCILQVGHCVPESLGGCGPATLLQPRHEPAGARAALSHTHTQEARQEQGRPRRCALFTLHMRVQDNLHTHTYIVAHTHPTHKYAHGCAVAQFTRKWSLGWKEDPEGAPAHVLVHDACVCTPACTQDKCPGRIRARAYIHTHAFTCPQNCKHLYTL